MRMMVYMKERFMNGWKSLGIISGRVRQRNRSGSNVVDIKTLLELVVFENRSAFKKRELCSQH